MTRTVITALLLLGLTTPSLAARIYLKEGGVIDAKSVWRSHGMVHVLVNRDTLAEFSPDELDMKRTFARLHRVQKKKTVATAAQAQATTQTKAIGAREPAGKKPGLSLPAMPTLPEATPGSLITGGDEGTIRKHKREMLEKANE